MMHMADARRGLRLELHFAERTFLVYGRATISFMQKAMRLT